MNWKMTYKTMGRGVGPKSNEMMAQKKDFFKCGFLFFSNIITKHKNKTYTKLHPNLTLAKGKKNY
jgi:hypothetical protein